MQSLKKRLARLELAAIDDQTPEARAVFIWPHDDPDAQPAALEQFRALRALGRRFVVVNTVDASGDAPEPLLLPDEVRLAIEHQDAPRLIS